MALAKLLLVHASLHGLVLIVVLPAIYLIMSLVAGAFLASAEGWDTLDGTLYVGGNMVLLPLTDVVPTSVGGTAVDMIVSMLTFGLLGWGLAIVGLLPFCDATQSSLHSVHRPTHKDLRPVLASLLTVFLFVVVLWPLVCIVLSAVIAAFLMEAEGWTYEDSFLRCLGVVSHAPSLAPPAEHPASDAGKIVILVNAFVGVGFTLGWTVGVSLLLPALNTVADSLSKVVIVESEGLIAKGLNFCAVVAAVVPLAVLPLAMLLGVVLSEVEEWDSLTDGFLHVAGNMVGIPLTTVAPTSSGGKAVDFVVSCVGVGCFGLLIAMLGALDFTDKCCESLGGKEEGWLAAMKFTTVFYVVVMPITCLAAAVPTGGLLAMAEGWSFTDGWLSVMSILAQAPSLAPPGLAVGSHGGKMVVFLVACYSLCVTIGWGAGLVVASKALDRVGDRISGVVTKIKAAAGVDNGIKVADSGDNTSPRAAAYADADAKEAEGTAPLTASAPPPPTDTIGKPQEPQEANGTAPLAASAPPPPTDTIGKPQEPQELS